MGVVVRVQGQGEDEDGGNETGGDGDHRAGVCRYQNRSNTTHSLTTPQIHKMIHSW